MLEKLYPKDKYPDGHPHLALTLYNLGSLLHSRGSLEKAKGFHERALVMDRRQIRTLASWASEAETLDLAQSLLPHRDALLSVTFYLPNSDSAAYAQTWDSRAQVTRVLQQRHLAACAAKEVQTQAAWQELRDTRRRLARLLLEPATGGRRRRDLASLSDHKETLDAAWPIGCPN